MGVKYPLPPWLEQAMTIRRKMKERGFHPNDRVQACERCGEYAEESWQLKNTQGMGGRSIMFCANCGRCRSWRKAGGPAEDPFDLPGFLGLPPTGAT